MRQAILQTVKPAPLRKKKPLLRTEGVPSATASHPVVTIEMDNGGVIKAELYPEVAPNTVNNFISPLKGVL